MRIAIEHSNEMQFTDEFPSPGGETGDSSEQILKCSSYLLQRTPLEGHGTSGSGEQPFEEVSRHLLKGCHAQSPRRSEVRACWLPLPDHAELAKRGGTLEKCSDHCRSHA
jgi:hypothetical protein